MVVIVDGKLETKLVDGLDERVKCLICKSLDKRHADNAFVETVWSSFFGMY